MACDGVGVRNKKALVRRRRARPADAAVGCAVRSVAASDVAGMGAMARRLQRIGSEVGDDRPQGEGQFSVDGDVGMVHVRVYKRQHKGTGWRSEVERAIEH